MGREENPSLPFIGSYTDSYFPMPYFIDPYNNKAFLLENSEYSQFDMCATHSATWSVETWNGSVVKALIFNGASPAAMVSHLTAEIGRPSTPAGLGFQWSLARSPGGTEAVRERVQAAQAADIPVTAVWVQDWLGMRELLTGNFGVKYHRIHDEEFYPNLKELISELRQDDIRFLGYFNNFVLPEFEHFEEMAQQGMLIKTVDGDALVFVIISSEGSIIDVSNPEALDYFTQFANKAIELGMSGWMADFGEWLPFDAVIANVQHRLTTISILLNGIESIVMPCKQLILMATMLFLPVPVLPVNIRWPRLCGLVIRKLIGHKVMAFPPS